MNQLKLLPLVLLLGSLGACGSREVLQPLAADNAGQTSFAGEWRLRGDRKLIDRKIEQAIRKTDGVRDGQVFAPDANRTRRPQRSSGLVKGGLVYVFLQNGELLKISQAETALFVSFDRAVVEEYRFGEDRTITVGQAEAQRVSGWAGSDYLIQTLDRNGMKLSERYQLSDDRQMLTRTITFRSSGGIEETVTELFSRRQE